MLMSGKVAIVTGAGNEDGIGFATARLLAEHGGRIALVDIDGDGVRDLAKKLGKNAMALQADITDFDACQGLVGEISSAWGKPGVLVHCAGVVQARKILEVSEADYNLMMGVNVRGTLHMSQAVIPQMTAGDSIICIASVSGQRGAGLMGGPHYAASKGAVLALMKSMARELGPTGIRVNAVNPGVISTAMNANAFDEATRTSITNAIPMRRFGKPADVAGACLFLSSDLSSYMTGGCIDINGGMHIF